MSKKIPILIAEDNPLETRILTKTFEKENHEIVTARDGQMALNSIEKKYFPIVITDWVMPEMDGIELCKAIRKRKIKHISI